VFVYYFGSKAIRVEHPSAMWYTIMALMAKIGLGRKGLPCSKTEAYFVEMSPA
jgi:hypothetical protein